MTRLLYTELKHCGKCPFLKLTKRYPGFWCKKSRRVIYTPSGLIP